MQKYDAALKSVLTRGTAGFLSRLMGLEVAGFLNSDLAEVRSQQVDLLGEASDGTLFHVELQSTNEQRMAFRMLWNIWWRLRVNMAKFPVNWFSMWERRLCGWKAG